MQLYAVFDLDGNFITLGNNKKIAVELKMHPESVRNHVKKREENTLNFAKKYNIYKIENLDVIFYELQKNILVKKRLNNDMYRLVKIRRGTIYQYDPLHNRDSNVIKLARNIERYSKNERIYYDEIHMNKEDFKKYFKGVSKE